jgi:serine/threonine protein kinase
MEWLPDRVVEHLRDVAELPDLTGTRYELVREIGRGGMGVVYEVYDTQLERNVALKVNTHHFPLTTEARILARLEHPGIVPVHDSGTLADGRSYYAMKLVQGERLDRYAAGAAALADRLRVFLRIAEPVAFAHSAGVLHRDLKPQNIMVGKFGEVLVLDWGVGVAGTPGYMAPEQAAGSPVDTRIDIYALGKTLQFLVAPCSPFPKPLSAVCRKATDEKPALRYIGVTELAAEVARFLDGMPVQAYREPLWERASRLLSRNKPLIALLAAYLVMRIALFVWLGR